MNANKKRYAPAKNDRGYALIEILIAIGIFSIGILAIANLQYRTSRNNTTGNLITQATLLARAQIEEFKTVTDVTTLDAGPFDDPNNPVDQNGDSGGIFTRSWAVTNPAGGSNTRQVEMTVAWTRDGRNRSVVLTSIIRNRNS
jgi:type IV pilus assembly protein PilV